MKDSFSVDNIEICAAQFASNSNSQLSVHLWYAGGFDIKVIYSVNTGGCFLQATNYNLKFSRLRYVVHLCEL